MTKITKNFITIVLAIAMFAAMATSAFAHVLNPEDVRAHVNNPKIARGAAYAYKWAEEDLVGARYANIFTIASDRLWGQTNGTYYVYRALARKNQLPTYDPYAEVAYTKQTDLLRHGIITADFPGFEIDPYSERVGEVWLDVDWSYVQTRQDYAVLMFRAAKYAGVTDDKDLPSFDIKDIDKATGTTGYTVEEAKEAIQYVVNHGFLWLDANGNFYPDNALYGADAVIAAYRLYKVVPQSDKYPFSDWVRLHTVDCYSTL